MKTLKKLFLDGIAEIYDAEVRLIAAMPKMAEVATCEHLEEAIRSHLEETRSHVKSLEAVFASVDERPKRKTSEAIIALLNESDEIMSYYRGFPVLNAALIFSLQKIEHHEIASYGCLRDWAAELDNVSGSDILQKILDEDKATNQALTELARQKSNHEGLTETNPDSTRCDVHGHILAEATI